MKLQTKVARFRNEFLDWAEGRHMDPESLVSLETFRPTREKLDKKKLAQLKT